MILRGEDAYEKTGITRLHAAAFQEVADRTGNVITCRAVGIYATGLINESYASKGFHDKAKSCNWGPMAGFVLDDPRFTKVGNTAKGRDGQQDALVHALHAGAIEVPLFISDERRDWLLKNRLMTEVSRDAASLRVYAVSPWGLRLEFLLKRARPGGAVKDMWAVLYQVRDRESARTRVDQAVDGRWTPVMAMRDPMCTVPASDYRAATTGDYDLFAVWAAKGRYQPHGADQRMIGHQALMNNIDRGMAATGEDEHLGNITQRIREVRDLLNEGFRRRGYTGGNMVHHSDEGGRPFVTDVDLPIFGVVPGRGTKSGDKPRTSGAFMLQDIGDLRQFITQELAGDYATVFSPGWMKQLVFAHTKRLDRNVAEGFVDRKELMHRALGHQVRSFDRSTLRRP
jgi:hypothetical protein